MATAVATTRQPEERNNGRSVEDPLDALLAAYDQTFATLQALPRIQRGGGIRVKHGIPPFRFRWGARHFVAYGINHTLRTLKRRYGAAVALNPRSEANQERLARVEQYEASLPPVPGKRVFLLSVAVAGLLGYLVASVLLPTGKADEVIGDMSGAVASLDFENAATIVKAEPTGAVIAAGLLFSFLWAMTYPFRAAFSLKRLVFNLYPDPESRLVEGAPSDLRPLSEGIYALEGKAAKAARVERPREFPFDLVLQAATILVVFPLWVVAAFTLDDVVANKDLDWQMKVLPWVLTAGVVAWSPGRLVHLWRIWCRRAGSTTAAGGSAAAVIAPSSLREAVWIDTAAKRTDRFLAAAVDVALVALGAFALGVAFSPFVNEDVLGMLILVAFPPAVGAVYASAFALARRPTLGKRWRNVEVVGVDGRPVGIYTLVAREGLFKWLVFGSASVFSLGIPFVLDAGFALFSKDRRALHDRLAKTRVADVDRR